MGETALEIPVRRETRRDVPQPIHLRDFSTDAPACGAVVGEGYAHRSCPGFGTKFTGESHCRHCARPICPCCLLEIGWL